MKLEQTDYLSVTEVDLSQEIVTLTSCRENEATAKTRKSGKSAYLAPYVAPQASGLTSTSLVHLAPHLAPHLALASPTPHLLNILDFFASPTIHLPPLT